MKTFAGIKKQELTLIVLVAVGAIILSLVASKLLFKPPASRGVTVPTINPTIQANFPDVFADNTYSSFLNKNALDPAQIIQIGNTNNKNPFQGQ